MLLDFHPKINILTKLKVMLRKLRFFKKPSVLLGTKMLRKKCLGKGKKKFKYETYVLVSCSFPIYS